MAINQDVGIDTSQYADFGAFFGPAWNKYNSLQGAGGPEQAASQLQSYGDTFKAQFRDMVGRDPSDAEMGTFYNTVVAPVGSFAGGANGSQVDLQNGIQNLLGTQFKQAAMDQTNLELQNQQGEANRLADLFRTQGRQAISDTESNLLNYQNKLFERLRPNLITSLQAQGLLNTGGLNQAVAGAQGDLANDAQRTLMDMNYQNEQGANAIAFGGASAPFQFQQAQTLNRVPQMQQNAQNSMTNMFQQRLNEQNYLQQMNLMAQQNKYQQGMLPSFGRTLGQTFAGGFGQSTGSSLGQWFSPSTASKAATMGAA